MREEKFSSEKEAFARLLQIMNELRAQCPWDRKQTTESLRHLTIEETFELSDAILEDQSAEIRNELGDLMLHIVFYAKIGSEKGEFDITSVINQLCEKLIRRHPHIYGDTVVHDEEQVKKNWEKIKLEEKGNKEKTVLGGVPRSLPSMIKALRIQEKVRGVGFDWPDHDGVLEKLMEEIKELEEATTPDEVEAEMGDMFFSLINYSRSRGVNPEDALERTNKKFIYRFNYMEEQAKKQGRNIADLTLSEMEGLWQQAKTAR